LKALFLFFGRPLNFKILSDECMTAGGIINKNLSVDCQTQNGMKIVRTDYRDQKFYCISYRKKTAYPFDFDVIRFDIHTEPTYFLHVRTFQLKALAFCETFFNSRLVQMINTTIINSEYIITYQQLNTLDSQSQVMILILISRTLISNT